MLVTVGSWAYFQQPATGPSMTRAASQFVGSLSQEQRSKALIAYEAPERLGWHFIPKATRKGLQIKEMSPEQRETAHALLKTCLSAVGYDKATKIMSLEHILHVLESSRGGRNIRDTERYYFTVFGTPAEQGQWGLSIEGHHLSLNFVVKDGQIASTTPAMFGANPATVKSEVEGGLPVGTRVLAEEEEAAFALAKSLNEAQFAKALIAAEAPGDIRAAGEAQPPQDAPAGIAASELTDDQRQLLRALVGAYLASMPDDVRQQRMAAIREAGTDRIHFAWAGPKEPGTGHYYRLQGPTFLIEFVNTQPDSAGNRANHIHSVWRDMRGDFALPAS
jgi:hypothetical protein